ncbi:MAG: MFS transporter [Eggerthellaceae bacterium]
MNTLLNRSFVSVIFAQIASLFGDAVLRFALPLYVLNQTGSAALMGAVSACAWIPYIVLTPIGGVAADRVNKRRIMAALDILLATTCAAFLALDGAIDLVGLCICALIVLYAAQSVYQPTVQAAVPFIVPRDGIVRATASSARSARCRASWARCWAACCSACSASSRWCSCRVRRSRFPPCSSSPWCASARRHRAQRRGRGAHGGERHRRELRVLRHERTVILKVIFLVAGINVTLTAFILIGAPVVITQILGLPNQYMGFAEGALALGGLAGGVSVGVFAGRLRLSRAPLFLLVAALGLLPIAVVLGVQMDAMAAYGLVVAGLFVSMACATMFSIQAISFVQLETPGHLVGKVIALTMSLANCAQPVGQLIYGGLFDALRGNLVPVALGTAAIAFVIGLVTFRVLKKGLAELQARAGAADAR